MPHTNRKAMSSLDPIWRYLWVSRIGKGLWLVFTIFYVCFFLYFRSWERQGFYFLLVGFLNLLMGINLVLVDIRQNKYWRRIGERRSAAWRDPAPFRARNQPLETETVLQLPVLIRLQASSKFMLGLFVTIFVFFGLCVTAGIYLGARQKFNLPLLLLGLGISLGICLLLFCFIYFAFLRPRAQRIELTEEGITTSYQGFTRSLRWEDITLFAQYPQGVVNKAVSGLAFELSNEQVVVRWSQQRVSGPALKVQSNQGQKDDFNWLVGLVNAFIAQRTGLPLLDLNDVPVVAADQAEQQNDPLTPHLKLNGQQLWSFGIMCLFGLALIVLSSLGDLFSGDTYCPW